jgi:hypothetical protein
MKPETIQRIMDAADETAKEMGVKNFDEVAEVVRKSAPICRFVFDFFETIKTRNEFSDLASKKNEPEPELVESLIRIIRAIPGFLASRMREAVKADVFPPAPKGRRSIDPDIRRDICLFIQDLQVKKGTSERVAKQRAAQHFHVSLRSVHRIWNERVEILKDSEMTPAAIFKRFTEIVRAYQQDKARQSEATAHSVNSAPQTPVPRPPAPETK